MDSLVNETLLVFFAFVSATISGTIGLAGGLLMLGVMTTFFPPSVLIPLHGFIQFWSNASRTVFNLKSVDKKVTWKFFWGALLGVGIGSQILITIPKNIYQIVLSIFILILIWMPKIKIPSKSESSFFFVGVFVSFLSLFAGATGPLLASFFSQKRYDRLRLVATMASCQAVQHLMKVILFVIIGFNFFQYARILVLMTLAMIVGNYCGKQLLGRLPERVFSILFKTVISFLAVRLFLLGTDLI